MLARVVDEGIVSEPFAVNNGTKQGCVLAPLLFNIFYAAMLLDAFRSNNEGIHIKYRTDGGIFNLQRLIIEIKGHWSSCSWSPVCWWLCTGCPHTGRCTIVDCFAKSAARFGLSMNIKKTEVVQQPYQPHESPGSLHVDNVPLNNVDRFCYLGSIISQDATMDNDITERIAKASQAFGRLRQRLWDDKNIRLETKISVYRSVVTSTLLYGAEAWTLYRGHIRKLDQYHMRCLRSIAGIRWQDKVPNTEVLDRCQISGIEAILLHTQLRWAGHLRRMPDNRLPKAVFYGQLASGERSRGRPLKRYKDCLKANLLDCRIDPSTWESSASDRSLWRTLCYEGVSGFEQQRVAAAQEKRQRRKAGPSATGEYECHICGRKCSANIGLFSHMRVHTNWSTHPFSTGESICSNPHYLQTYSVQTFIICKHTLFKPSLSANILCSNPHYLQTYSVQTFIICKHTLFKPHYLQTYSVQTLIICKHTLFKPHNLQT